MKSLSMYFKQSLDLGLNFANDVLLADKQLQLSECLPAQLSKIQHGEGQGY
jgi:hypothetical protein